eukprot:jgi/Hompol1/3816/HPOL_003362-RA
MAEAELTALFERIQANSLDYDAHVALIAALKQLGDIESLRQARRAIAAVFPLTQELWMDWIADEQRLAAEPHEKQALIDLFELAVVDYLSIPIWKLYIEFLFDEYNEGVEDGTLWLDLEQIRRVCARAIKATSHHFTKSHLIWQKIMDFEIQLIQDTKDPERVTVLRKMFLDRLKIPHQEIDATLSSYSSFETAFDNEHYLAHMKKSTELSAKCKKEIKQLENLERKLAQSNYSLEGYEAYIAAEKMAASSATTDRIRAIYERAIESYCLHPALWDSYILARRPKSEILGEMTMHVFSLAEIGFYCSLETVRETFKESVAYIDAIPNADPYCQLRRFWAHEEAYVMKDAAAARAVYHAAVKQSSHVSQLWLDYALFERMQGDISKARSLFKQATLQRTDDPNRIHSEWISFERTFGDLESLYQAIDKIGIASKRISKVS